MSGFADPRSDDDDQPVTEATRACILAIAIDRLARQAEWDMYAAALLADYRRLKAGDIGQRIIEWSAIARITEYPILSSAHTDGAAMWLLPCSQTDFETLLGGVLISEALCPKP